MSEKLPPVPGEDSFDEFLSAHLPEETSSEISRLVTPWTEAFLLILLSIGIGLLNFPDQPLLGIIQGAASSAFGLLGWNRLRGENKSFRHGWILMLIRSVWYLADALLKSTLWSDALNRLLSADILFILGLVSALLFLSQLVCLRDGIAAVQKKAGAKEDTSAVSFLIGAYAVLLVLALLNAGGFFVIIMFIVIVVALYSVFRLSHVLDEAGYAVTPSPVKITAEALLGTFFGILVIGSLIGVIFFSRLPMKWQAPEPYAHAETAAVREDLLALGFPETVLDDLAEEDILACKGAVGLMRQESFYHDGTLDGLKLESIAVVLSEKPRVWKVFYHFTLPDEKGYYGTDALELRPMQLFGWTDFTEEPHGRILIGQKGETKAAAIPSVTRGYYRQQGVTFGSFSTGFSGDAYFASFSLPNKYENARGYVTLSVSDPYPAIDFAWGENAKELIWSRYFSGLYYIHQVNGFHYPVQSAEAFRKSSSYMSRGWEFAVILLEMSWFFPE